MSIVCKGGGKDPGNSIIDVTCATSTPRSQIVLHFLRVNIMCSFVLVLVVA